MRLMLKTLVIGCVVAASSVAYAGYKLEIPVTIYAGYRIAEGTLGSARNSADSTQYIGCNTVMNNLGGGSYAACTARNAAGAYATCYSYSAEAFNAIRSMSGDSYVRFEWDVNGVCTYLNIENQS